MYLLAKYFCISMYSEVEVEDAHPERDPLHVPGPHRDEEAVQVPPLGPGAADAGPGHVVSPPREAQHLTGERLKLFLIIHRWC